MNNKPNASNKKLRQKKPSTADASGHVRDAETTIPGLPVFNNRCFGCSPGNRDGLRLKFLENLADGSVECIFRVSRRFEGPPGHVHGGIIATVLDEAMGKVNRQKGIVALTRRMSVDYLQPVPLGVKLLAVGWPVSQDGRKHFHAGEIRTPAGIVLARSDGLFIAINPVEMFRKHRHPLSGAGKASAAGTGKLKTS